VQAPPDAHRLGPHVVGQRVVIRRLLRGQTGPSGGPAMTDVLGICTAWGGGRCTVVPESGEAVEIELADIVSGKPVPPRPSVRHRVPVRAAEEHTVHLFPGLETERLGEWVLRTVPVIDGRLVKRANSALAMGDPGLALAEAAERVRAFYTARGRPVLAQVEAGSQVEQALVGLGWRAVPGGDAEFLLGSLAQALRRIRSPEEGVVCLSTTPAPVSGTRPVHAEARLGDTARGLATRDGDWLGLHGVEVDPGHRRRGLATAIVAELLDWGASLGATTAWLHVEVDNEPALALYEGLGFRPHHSCRYLSLPR
jgi:N-acetylglutamate synthase